MKEDCKIRPEWVPEAYREVQNNEKENGFPVNVVYDCCEMGDSTSETRIPRILKIIA